jgi:uncharacterized protein YbdZ (MbtH family)
MVENRRLLVALVLVLLIGIGARYGLTKVELNDGVYYTDAPDETPSFRAVEVYVCPKCIAAIYEAFPKRAYDEQARNILETYRLIYDQMTEDGRCPHHPDQPLETTTRIPVAPGAKMGLPADTDYIARTYRAKAAPPRPGDQINFMVVISSRDKRSIHRPESCLPSQGWTMVTQQTREIECKRVPGGKLSVRSLLMEKPGRDARGNLVQYQLAVFYWYAALPKRLTSSEYVRLATMFYDRLVRGSNYRWSYVLISKLVQPGQSPAQVNHELVQFVTEFTDIVERDNAASPGTSGEGGQAR